MSEIVLFLILVTLAQVAILRLWFTAEIFSECQAFFTGWRKTETGIKQKVGYLMTCWQCIGVWVAGLVAGALACSTPEFKELSWAAIILIALAAAFLSEMFYIYYMVYLENPSVVDAATEIPDLDAGEDNEKPVEESAQGAEVKEEETKDVKEGEETND